ncbi:erythrocyte membrane protein 1, PfEMP1, putative [Plasmodium reichenowi]|uniref:Erythrocyte membrane protein 1, PfEMP1, putative n=1 Tax=Plasmodium reichenowi TaxID=5854 RepID=A0A2P9DTA6_PLARE|nr:erythrocyte membrane protein 1, PfEMP1, putative [Plasmodium reichenowi]
MLCGYNKPGGDTSNSENCRFPDIEPVPQFLRWFQEWTKIFFIRRKKLVQQPTHPPRTPDEATPFSTNPLTLPSYKRPSFWYCIGRWDQ